MVLSIDPGSEKIHFALMAHGCITIGDFKIPNKTNLVETMRDPISLSLALGFKYQIVKAANHIQSNITHLNFKEHLTHIILEKAQASPQMGATSAFNYGQGFGILLSALHFNFPGFPIYPMYPASWKSYHGMMKKPKGESIKRLRKLEEEKKVTLMLNGVKLDHNKADAALMGYFATHGL